MQRNLWLLIALLTLAGLSGCKKVWDYFKQNPHEAALNCRIETISYTDSEEFTAHFFYNTHGKPIIVQYDQLLSGIWPLDKRFRYDDRNRLLVYVSEFYEEGLFSTSWHMYTYVSPTKVIDTAYSYCTGNYAINNHPDTFADMNVSELTLDMWGRIIKEVNSFSGESIYRYDFNGNLIQPGLTYTNKPNLRQTNEVWRFIDRNYSINQPDGEVEEFNIYNLPYRFNNETTLSSSRFSNLPIGFQNTVVTYTCE